MIKLWIQLWVAIKDNKRSPQSFQGCSTTFSSAQIEEPPIPGGFQIRDWQSL
ncbi:MAG: hypothetical protein F6K50_21050 [Moorea sp. SIO3I7]|uniref:hypothetical protein n=1 Tax=unclassified Moorena TaxID=2683338 RepID=UPI0013BF011A|nr:MULTISPECIES: hypothetical protein [unclassified Moorena]NEN97912.1 hypothetical protein [Moorena sp. SIO3I7]NEO09767.1 hypothetical protein [Moorena sp. SIO3I8]NEP27763.1 hypothetical protein [Moorena sp. SIO3I6]